MPFIKSSELDRLRRIERNQDDIKKVEKRYKRELDREREENEETIEDLNFDHEREVTKLQRKVDQAEKVRNQAVSDATAEQADTLKTVKREHQKSIDLAIAERDALSGQVKTLTDKIAAAGDLKVKELDLVERENAFKSKEARITRKSDELDVREKELDELKKTVETDQYNKGYVDGTTDTLRETNEAISKNIDKAYDLAQRAIDKDTVVISTTTPATTNKK